MAQQGTKAVEAPVIDQLADIDGVETATTVDYTGYEVVLNRQNDLAPLAVGAIAERKGYNIRKENTTRHSTTIHMWPEELPWGVSAHE